jgi:hypothetical protein
MMRLRRDMCSLVAVQVAGETASELSALIADIEAAWGADLVMLGRVGQALGRTLSVSTAL